MVEGGLERRIEGVRGDRGRRREREVERMRRLVQLFGRKLGRVVGRGEEEVEGLEQ